jgi:hypothetical protein
MANDDSPVGYKRPPVQSRFQKGQSGNPRGRPNKMPDFFDDAAAILGAPVTGHAKGEQITLSMAQAMFRRLCREALKGDNAALRRVVELMLTLEPTARQQAEQKAKSGDDSKRKLAKMLGLDPDVIYGRPKEPDPKMEKIKKQADAMAKEERKRLLREAKRRKQMR